MDALLPELTEEEQVILKRGRNAKPYTKAKHATMAEYKKATALEALMGYLYLTGQEERMLLLIQKGMDALMEGRTVFVIAHRLSTVRKRAWTFWKHRK